MAIAVEVTRSDMHAFLVNQGFQEIQVPGTKERVYSKLVDKGLCQRVLTSIVGESSRGVGEDAIRVQLVVKVDGQVKLVGMDKRVHRVEGWRKNLQTRLDRWREQLGPSCPKCGAATVQRRSKRGPFWGCCTYPQCNSIQPVTPVRHTIPAGERGGEHEEAGFARQERGLRQDDLDLERSISKAMEDSEAAFSEGILLNPIAQHFADKAKFADLERQQEEAAYRAEMVRDARAETAIAIAELEANGIIDGDDDAPPANW